MHSKRLEPHELDKIASATLSYYAQRAEDFRAGTRDHDVSQNIAALLRHIDGETPFVILDFGCGPGRDLKASAGLGHTAIGLEGAAGLAAMARADAGGEGGGRANWSRAQTESVRHKPDFRVGFTRSPFGPRRNRDATAVEMPRRRPRQSCRGFSNPLQRRALAIQLRPSARRSGRQVVGEEYTLEIVLQWGESAQLRVTSVHGMKYKHWPGNPRPPSQCVCRDQYSPAARNRHSAFHHLRFHAD